MDSYTMPLTARQIITGQCYGIFQIHTCFYTQQYLANTFREQRFQVDFTGCLARLSFRSVHILRFCTVFLSSSRQVQGQYLKSNQLRSTCTFLPFQTPYNHSLTQQVYQTLEYQDFQMFRSCSRCGLGRHC